MTIRVEQSAFRFCSGWTRCSVCATWINRVCAVQIRVQLLLFFATCHAWQMAKMLPGWNPMAPAQRNWCINTFCRNTNNAPKVIIIRPHNLFLPRNRLMWQILWIRAINDKKCRFYLSRSCQELNLHISLQKMATVPEEQDWKCWSTSDNNHCGTSK